MNKKQRCFLKRFAALVAVLVMCAVLCVPAFASNNASTKKWRIVAEDQRRGENGQLTTYFKLSPYENGALYAATFTTYCQAQYPNDHTYQDVWVIPVNYPDWWRSPIPLGAQSYVEISSPTIFSGRITYISGSVTVLDSSDYSYFYLYPFNISYASTLTSSRYSSGSSLSTPFLGFPYKVWDGNSALPALHYTDGFVFDVGGTFGSLSSVPNLIPSLSFDINLGFSYRALPGFTNASSDQIIWALLPKYIDGNGSLKFLSSTLSASAVISYWVDANKLPAGLQVGDEFPADTDAFDQLRDDLIDQFPEAFDNVQNGKATIQGWNDTETVDSDVASTSISALNALFQNLGGFLFIVSLMVFGAVVLRMLIRKAVDG